MLGLARKLVTNQGKLRVKQTRLNRQSEGSPEPDLFSLGACGKGVLQNLGVFPRRATLCRRATLNLTKY